MIRCAVLHFFCVRNPFSAINVWSRVLQVWYWAQISDWRILFDEKKRSIYSRPDANGNKNKWLMFLYWNAFLTLESNTLDLCNLPIIKGHWFYYTVRLARKLRIPTSISLPCLRGMLTILPRPITNCQPSAVFRFHETLATTVSGVHFWDDKTDSEKVCNFSMKRINFSREEACDFPLPALQF